MQIQQDLLTAFSQLRVQSGDQIDPEKDKIIVAIASDSVDYLNTPPVYGDGNVKTWLKESCPNVEVRSAPELNKANANQSVFYVYPESVQDSSTDGGRVWDHINPTKFRLLGVEQKAKGLLEDYSNATAGAMAKRPWAIVRVTNIG